MGTDTPTASPADMETMGTIMRLVAGACVDATSQGRWYPKPIAEAILAAIRPRPLDVDRLAQAMTEAAPAGPGIHAEAVAVAQEYDRPRRPGERGYEG